MEGSTLGCVFFCSFFFIPAHICSWFYPSFADIKPPKSSEPPRFPGASPFKSGAWAAVDESSINLILYAPPRVYGAEMWSREMRKEGNKTSIHFLFSPKKLCFNSKRGYSISLRTKGVFSLFSFLLRETSVTKYLEIFGSGNRTLTSSTRSRLPRRKDSAHKNFADQSVEFSCTTTSI